MNILIIGNGAREYSIALKIKQSPKLDKLFFANGNGATLDLGKNITYNNYEELISFVKKENIELTIVGTEQPLVDGIVDIFKKHNLCIFGPSKEASKLEGSKIYMKEMLKRFNIPTAKYVQGNNKEELLSFIKNSKTLPIVVKADGLCAGKGVIIAQSKEEATSTVKDMLSGEKFKEAGKNIVIEEFLDGYELSLFAICDGENYKLFPVAQDHKRLHNDDIGPNTGGMGAYAPTPLINDVLLEKIKDRIITPTIQGMKKENNPYEGILFAGLMIVNDEPFLLEYNVRFGDPECEVIMPLVKNDMLDVFIKASTNRLNEINLEFYDKHCIGVVMSSKNYPFSSSEKTKITFSDTDKSSICFAGVDKLQKDLYATGGRVLVCVGTGDSLELAKKEVYDLCNRVKFDGNHYRTDIGFRAINKS